MKSGMIDRLEGAGRNTKLPAKVRRLVDEKMDDSEVHAKLAKSSCAVGPNLV